MSCPKCGESRYFSPSTGCYPCNRAAREAPTPAPAPLENPLPPIVRTWDSLMGWQDVITANVMHYQQERYFHLHLKEERVDGYKNALSTSLPLHEAEAFLLECLERVRQCLPTPEGTCEFCGKERLQDGEGGCPDDDCEYWDESASWPARSAQWGRDVLG